ncbi:HNH endonuclease signature motif containing protein [Cupriavidus oxalaticus]|uniref:HNH endonuclease n=1 Tax=Cupriavidus oxalaticus TaxID=96344 RepID=A0A5P3VMP5_9BURK|nr:HNH endonuclease signature motif containing protein [Cupriavidus oxalaticus]QEZ47218.1 HNH endonuclease [Cupriavidus oxalaticus]
MARRFWTEVELAVLRDCYPNSKTEDIAAALKRPTHAVYNKALAMGLRKSEAYLSSPDAGRLDGKRGAGSRFVAGQPSWNKGVKGSTGTHPNCRQAQFKKGERRGAANANYVPIGTERISKDGYLERKVTDDPNLVPARRWVGVHRLVWEAAHGPIPPGHAVTFLPGRRTADAALITEDALELVSRGELARRNHPRARSPELAKLVQLKGAITRQVNRIAREAKEKQQ